MASRLLSQLRQTGAGAAPRRMPGAARRRHASTDTKNFVQEHDYTVTPTTYAYTTEANKELFERFPLVTARQLARRKERPRRVRMLAREFIDDSMYNPHYGYFSKAAEIFTLRDKFDVGQMGSLDAFVDRWAVEYRRQQRAGRGAEASATAPAPGTATGTATGTASSAMAPQAAASATAHTTSRQSRASIGTARSGAGGTASATSAAPRVAADEQKYLRPARVSRQLWHTPSELFTPHYGRALARYIVDQHVRGDAAGADASGEQEPLVIYETGAGNGTLMVDVLDHLAAAHPELYARTEYHIIEISAALSLRQRAQAAGHGRRVRVHHSSVFDWAETEARPCFFVALEVWDNLAHDVIRYDNATDRAYQGYMVVDPNGDFTEVFSPKLDALAAAALEARRAVGFTPDRRLGWHPLAQPRAWRRLQNAVRPFQGGLSAPEYVPTRYFELLRTLAARFPRHRLLASDFTHFPGRTRGYCSPVVQTFMEDTPVTVSTHMVVQGYFDIMFPTDFELARRLYEHVVGRPVAHASHGEFLRRWADPASATRTGESPMLSLYRNAAFLAAP